MKLKTSLLLGAIFPIIFPVAMILALWIQRSSYGVTVIGIPFLAVMGIIGLSMSGIVIAYSRNIANKIEVLNQWVAGVLAGNLDQSFEIADNDDEISRLSQALGTMLTEIRVAYGTLQKEAMHYQHQTVEQRKRLQTSEWVSQNLLKAMETLSHKHAVSLRKNDSKDI